jgi:hypothetical protein
LQEERSEVQEITHPCARSIRERAALAWGYHLTGRLRCPQIATLGLAMQKLN